MNHEAKKMPVSLVVICVIASAIGVVTIALTIRARFAREEKEAVALVRRADPGEILTACRQLISQIEHYRMLAQDSTDRDFYGTNTVYMEFSEKKLHNSLPPPPPTPRPQICHYQSR